MTPTTTSARGAAAASSFTATTATGRFIAALGRGDYQLLRTIALALRARPTARTLLTALTDALDRVTAQKKDTVARHAARVDGTHRRTGRR